MIDGLKPYPAMKDSGVLWLGEVPEHWRLWRTKTLLRERVQKGFPDETLLAATQTKGVVRKEQYENRTVLALKDLHLLKLVCRGDFVISLRSFQGGIEYAREQGIISPAYTVLYPAQSDMHGFLAWLLKSKPYVENLSLYVTGIRQGQNIDYEKLSRSELPLPPLSEQAAIVRFLDHADRQIRRYIRAKQKLIKLLEEQKQAIIHRAVTRGLDPNARLKPSGVEWLGDVPEHWEVVALRHRYSQCLGKMLDSKRITGNYSLPYLRNTDVQWDRINTEDLPAMDIQPAEYDRYTVQRDDLLVCEGGDVGRCALWSGELDVCGFQKALHRLRPIDGSQDVPRFLYYALRAASKANAFSDGRLSTIAHLTGDKLRAHRFPFPPAAEQERLVHFLDAEMGQGDCAVAATLREIDLLREYRTRLIADVVTGKLDVRDAAARLPDEAEEPELPGDTELSAEGEDSVEVTDLDAAPEEAEA
jgi:type I restriction enzyme S subunit